MWRLPASWAAVRGATPFTDLPSESSTIAAGGGLPVGPGVAVRVRTAARTASPVAVPPLALSRCSADFTARRSVVGDCRIVGVWLNAITPTFTCFGTPSANAVPATRRDQPGGLHVLRLHRAAHIGH